jgi:hypothetical protein
MDDFVFFSDSKQELNIIFGAIKDYLQKIGLTLPNRKCNIFKTETGVNFLGFKIFPTHRILLKRNIHRIKARLRYFQQKYTKGEITLEEIRQSLASWLGHVKWGDVYQLTNSIMERFSF